MEPARVIVEVTAGLIPGRAEPQFTKRWAVTSLEWQERGEEVLREREQEADEYARQLREPSRLNWVRTDWLWL